MPVEDEFIYRVDYGRVGTSPIVPKKTAIKWYKDRKTKGLPAKIQRKRPDEEWWTYMKLAKDK